MPLRRARTLLACFLFASLVFNPLVVSAAQEAPTLSGFGPESATRQRALEARFDALLKKENLREWMRRLAARPHHVGSEYGRQNAEFMAALFRSWGY